MKDLRCRDRINRFQARLNRFIYWQRAIWNNTHSRFTNHTSAPYANQIHTGSRAIPH